MSETNNALAMFDGLPAGGMQELDREEFGTPYIGFAHQNMKKWSAVIQSCGVVPEGTPLLFRPDGSIERIDNMRFWLTPVYYQHWSQVDNGGALLRSFPENPKQMKLDPTPGETVESVIIVMSLDGPVPARCRFRTTKCPAVHDTIAAVGACQQEGWARTPDQQAAVQAIKQPWLRVTGTVVLTAKPAKPGKKPYTLANASMRPTSAGDFAAIMQCLKNDEWRDAMQKCVDEHNKNVTEVKGKQ